MDHNQAMKTLTRLLLIGSLASCSVSYKLRSPEQYREDTRALLESEESTFQTCYEGVLASSSDATGTVVVSFEVAEETGKFSKAQSLPASTAPDTLQQCVVDGLNGLELAPPDDKTGAGTMTFEFSQE